MEDKLTLQREEEREEFLEGLYKQHYEEGNVYKSDIQDFAESLSEYDCKILERDLISDHKAVVDKMQNKIDELEKLKAESIIRFKNDCVSIFVHKYKQDKKEMIEHMNCLSDEEYFDYIVGETLTEAGYVGDDISNWD